MLCVKEKTLCDYNSPRLIYPLRKNEEKFYVWKKKKVYLKRQDITKNWLLSPLSAIEYLKNTTQLLIWRLSISLAKHQKIVI